MFDFVDSDYISDFSRAATKLRNVSSSFNVVHLLFAPFIISSRRSISCGSLAFTIETNTFWLMSCSNISIKIQEVHSFKSSEHIRKEVDGPYFEVSAKTASSVTLQ